MKTFSTKITNQYGEITEFKISIDERKKSGTLLYLKEEYPLIKCSLSPVNKGVHFLMRIGEYIKLVATLFPISDRNALCLLFGHDIPNNYEIDEVSYSNLKTFIENLNLPTTHEAIEAYVAREWNEPTVSELTKKHLSIYLGWKPLGSDPLIKFLNIAVNNKEVDLTNSYPFPGNQGIIVDVGSFEQGNEYLVSWKCETEYVPYGASSAIGYFVNNDLSTRKILKIREIEPFEEWTDVAKITL